MNILPKKNWHVRTRKNIEKVRRDEARAADEERKLQSRIDLAEREARIDYLRKKSKALHGSEEPFAGPSRRQVDIFADAQEGKGDVRVNVEHEKEEKARKEKWEERVGILTYLHKKNEDIDKPWYLQPHETRMTQDDPEAEMRREKNQQFNDPLVTMNRYMDQMKKRSKDDVPSHVKRFKPPVRESRMTAAVSEPSTDKSGVEKLREERLKREEREREKAQRLLAQVRRSGSSVRSVSRDVDERRLRFNSQFNPHLAKH